MKVKDIYHCVIIICLENMVRFIYPTFQTTFILHYKYLAAKIRQTPVTPHSRSANAQGGPYGTTCNFTN